MLLVTPHTDTTPWIGNTILIANYGRLGAVAVKVETASHVDAPVFTGIAISGVVDGGRTYIGLTYNVESVKIMDGLDPHVALSAKGAVTSD